MRGRLNALCAGLALLCMTAAWSVAQGEVGTVLAIEGRVVARKADGAGRVLATNDVVFAHDTIMTGAGAKIQILLKDDTTLSQGENSEMTIDEFVFSENAPEDSGCLLKLVTGVFRVITGKITKLNPDRFRVRTRMATIGIRGCTVGIRISEFGEHVYVVEIHGEERVTIYSTQDAQGLWLPLLEGGLPPEEAQEKLIEIVQAGYVVAIVQGQDMEQRALTPEELVQLIRDVTPAGPGQERRHGTGAVNGDGESDGGAGALTGDEALFGDARDGVGDGLDVGVNAPKSILDGIVLVPTFDERRDDDDRVSLDDRVVRDDGVTPGPNTTFKELASGRNNNWKLGIWETDGLLERVETLVRPDSRLVDGRFTDILNGATGHSLRGNGRSAAVVAFGGDRTLIDGTCSLNVTVGNGYTPWWGGSFSLGGRAGTADLRFEVNGRFDGDGTMRGDVFGYLLQVDGKNFNQDSLTREAIRGWLLGTGSGSTPIEAAAGNYKFENRNGAGTATVEGGYGVDF